MRDYGVVRVRFWEWAKRKALSLEERELALYLLTSPHGNSLGCFRLPTAYLCDDLGKGIETVTETVSKLSAVGFVERDDASGWTWIVGFLEHNPIPNRNVGKSIEKQVDAVPVEVSFYGRLVEVLRSTASPDDKGISLAFLDRVSERYRNHSDTVTRRSKTHTQTHEHEHTHNPSVAKATAAPAGQPGNQFERSSDDPKAVLFGPAVREFVGKATRKPSKAVGALIGKWLKDFGDDAAALLTALGAAQDDPKGNLVEWIGGVVRRRKANAPPSTVEEVLAQRANDPAWDGVQ